MTLSVHQVVPVLSEHDATGQHTRQVQRLLREQGMASEIYAGHVVPGADGWARPLKELAGADVLLYQCSVGSDLAAWCLRPRRAAGRQLPQHDAGAVLRRLAARPGCRAALGP